MLAACVCGGRVAISAEVRPGTLLLWAKLHVSQQPARRCCPMVCGALSHERAAGMTRIASGWHHPRMPSPRPSKTRAAASHAGDVSTTRTAEQVRLRILDVICAIPAGEVAGYGEVAMRAGLPGRARLVAKLLSSNQDAALPWHRVLRSDGRIALPEGSAGYQAQCQRLRAEGVPVERGRVRRATAAQRLDAAVWGPS